MSKSSNQGNSFVSSLSEIGKNLLLYVKVIFLTLTAGSLAILFIAIIITITIRDKNCIMEDEFLNKWVVVESDSSSGVIGEYNHSTGGQRASWKKTELITNGDDIAIRIKGSWYPWAIDNIEINNIRECALCAKIEDISNCVCKYEFDYNSGNIIREASTKEDFTQDNIINSGSIDCSQESNYVNPDLCTCDSSIQFGSYDHFLNSDIYFINTNNQHKNETLKSPDEQSECILKNGLGLYMSFFRNFGIEDPQRAYHLYSITESCPTTRNGNGECLDRDGNDITSYIFVHKNPPKDAEIALKIYDGYYHDNNGYYSLEFLSGIKQKEEDGIFTHVVSQIENIIFGEKLEDGTRVGGTVKFLYNSIVRDSSFILIVQLFLAFSIIFVGFGLLAGFFDLERKEFTQIVLKISIVILFTSEFSWYFYDKIVVGIFKNGMDGMLSMVSHAMQQDYTYVTDSHHTKFEYPDDLIRLLFSKAVARKIWGLVFSEAFFGILYVIAIYALIFFLIYILLICAFIYITAIIKLSVVLAIGPLFILFSLIVKLDEIFKRWMLFLAARAFEVVAVFTVLYVFINIFESNFRELLYIKTCFTDKILFGVLKVTALESKTDRSTSEWFVMIFKLGIFIYFFRLLIEKIPGIASTFVSLNKLDDTRDSTARNRRNIGAFALGKEFGNYATSGVKKVVTSPVTKYLGASYFKATERAADYALRKATRNKVTIYPNEKLESLVENIKSSFQDRGMNSKNLDNAVRASVEDKVSKMTLAEKKLYGINDKTLTNTLNKVLVEKELKKFLKERSSELKLKLSNSNKLQDTLLSDTKSFIKDNFVDTVSANSFIDNNPSYLHKVSKFKSNELNSIAKVLGKKQYNEEEITRMISTTSMSKNKQQKFLRKYLYEKEYYDKKFKEQDEGKSRTLKRIARKFGVNPEKNFFSNQRLELLDLRKMKKEEKFRGLNMERDDAFDFYKKQKENIYRRASDRKQKMIDRENDLTVDKLKKTLRDDLRNTDQMLIKKLGKEQYEEFELEYRKEDYNNDLETQERLNAELNNTNVEPNNIAQTIEDDNANTVLNASQEDSNDSIEDKRIQLNTKKLLVSNLKLSKNNKQSKLNSVKQRLGGLDKKNTNNAAEIEQLENEIKKLEYSIQNIDNNIALQEIRIFSEENEIN